MQLGEEEAAFDAFHAWIDEAKAIPDDAVFASILGACAHKGLVDKGESLYFRMMNGSHGIAATLEQSSCMVDLFGRAGQLEKSAAVIENMPFCDDARAWLTLLGICRNSESASLGELAFKHVLEFDERNVGAYVYMSNTYATWS
jgi:pentatricopeptide repeat protein